MKKIISCKSVGNLWNLLSYDPVLSSFIASRRRRRCLLLMWRPTNSTLLRANVTTPRRRLFTNQEEEEEEEESIRPKAKQCFVKQWKKKGCSAAGNWTRGAWVRTINVTDYTTADYLIIILITCIYTGILSGLWWAFVRGFFQGPYSLSVVGSFKKIINIMFVYLFFFVWFTDMSASGFSQEEVISLSLSLSLTLSSPRPSSTHCRRHPERAGCCQWSSYASCPVNI